jgi:DNA-binding NarL/FixJ family response regulator
MKPPIAVSGDAEHGAIPRPLSVMLVDQYTVMREGLSVLIEQQPDIVVVAQASTVTGAASFDVTPDVIVAEVDLPDARHAEVISGLHGHFPDSRILVLTVVDDPAKVQSVVAAGADGYLLKTAAAHDLLDGIRALARGETYLQSSSRPELERWGWLRDATLQLTPAEVYVLRLIARGYTNAEVANLQGISPRTVETHRSRIYQKLGLRTRAELFQYAWDTGLL